MLCTYKGKTDTDKSCLLPVSTGNQTHACCFHWIQILTIWAMDPAMCSSKHESIEQNPINKVFNRWHSAVVFMTHFFIWSGNVNGNFISLIFFFIKKCSSKSKLLKSHNERFCWSYGSWRVLLDGARVSRPHCQVCLHRLGGSMMGLTSLLSHTI